MTLPTLPLPTQKYQKLLGFLQKQWTESQKTSQTDTKTLHYWKMGQRLSQEKAKLDPESETTLFEALIQELQMEHSLFYRVLQLHQTWPKGLPPQAVQANFNWTHFRSLLTVTESKARNYYLKRNFSIS